MSDRTSILKNMTVKDLRKIVKDNNLGTLAKTVNGKKKKKGKVELIAMIPDSVALPESSRKKELKPKRKAKLSPEEKQAKKDATRLRRNEAQKKKRQRSVKGKDGKRTIVKGKKGGGKRVLSTAEGQGRKKGETCPPDRPTNSLRTTKGQGRKPKTKCPADPIDIPFDRTKPQPKKKVAKKSGKRGRPKGSKNKKPKVPPKPVKVDFDFGIFGEEEKPKPKPKTPKPKPAVVVGTTAEGRESDEETISEDFDRFVQDEIDDRESPQERLDRMRREKDEDQTKRALDEAKRRNLERLEREDRDEDDQKETEADEEDELRRAFEEEPKPDLVIIDDEEESDQETISIEIAVNDPFADEFGEVEQGGVRPDPFALTPPLSPAPEPVIIADLPDNLPLNEMINLLGDVGEDEDSDDLNFDDFIDFEDDF